MHDTTDIYLDTANQSALWSSLHRDATHLTKDAFAAAHVETIRQHYLNIGHSISPAQAHDMAHEVWWDVRVLGVDPTIGIRLPPPASAGQSERGAPTASAPQTTNEPGWAGRAPASAGRGRRQGYGTRQPGTKSPGTQLEARARS